MEKTKRRKMIAILVALSISLTGCASKEELKESDKTTDKTTEQVSDETALAKKVVRDSISQINPEESIINETTAIKYFEDQEASLDVATAVLSKEEVKAGATEYLKNTVDFVFNDKEVNGVTFSNLSNEAKARIINSIEDTNDILTDSGLTDITIEASKDAKLWTLSTLKEASVVSKIVLQELMGEATYNKAAGIATEAKTRVINAFNKAKEYIKEKN